VPAQLAAALAALPSHPRAGDAQLAVRRARLLWLETLMSLVEHNRMRKERS
jgi:hypothetical protein